MEIFTGFFAFPTYPLLKSVLHRAGPGRASAGAASAKPAFVRIEQDRWFTCFRIWHKTVRTADINAVVAAVAGLGIYYYRFIGHNWIGYHLSISHLSFNLRIMSN